MAKVAKGSPLALAHAQRKAASEAFKKLTPQKQFLEKATSKTVSAIKKIRSIGGMSRYEYTKEQVENIFGRLERELEQARARFTFGVKEKGKRKEIEVEI